MTRPTVICLTPVRNEAWILERFLRCASLWADRIIVADQGSTDGSREIIGRFEKAVLVDNPDREYNEVARQRLLLSEARRIPGPRVLIALDADEFLTGNALSHPEWRSILAAAPGTRIRFDWRQIRPDFRNYWTDFAHPMGLVDDGREHGGSVLHSPRLPVTPDQPELRPSRIGVMHYHYVDWRRMESKVRWYQCWERMRDPHIDAVSRFRFYHGMLRSKADLHPLPKDWLAPYENAGIDMTSVLHQPAYPWDAEVFEWMREHGPATFAREFIWFHDWTAVARKAGHPDPDRFRDPRPWRIRKAHGWLYRTQPRRDERTVRWGDRLIRAMRVMR